MKKDSTAMNKRGTATNRTSSREAPMRKSKAATRSTAAKTKAMPEVTIGIDLGDRTSHYCVLDGSGAVIEEGRATTTAESFRRHFGSRVKSRIAMEVGTHSPWASRLLKELGHEVLVANARRLRMIYDNRRKQDRVDARTLARVARMDPTLLSSIEHRPAELARDMTVLRARDLLVRTRTQLINQVRGAVKSSGARLKKCSSGSFAKKALEQVPESLRQALSPILVTIELVSEQIRDLDAKVEELADESYPQTRILRQVDGVGALIALAFVLTLQDPGRFAKSRAVGAYLGLVPSRNQSGSSDPQLRITKEGDRYLRRLLVQGAHYILGPFGPDCDLRRFGLALTERGGKNARRRAIVAVARKLAVLLHRLWKTGEVYERLRGQATAARVIAVTQAA